SRIWDAHPMPRSGSNGPRWHRMRLTAPALTRMKMLWRSSKKSSQNSPKETPRQPSQTVATGPTPPTESKPTREAVPLEGVDAILADLDGVVYKGEFAIDGAVESLNNAGVRV